jgi:hypothetical protein
MATLYITEFQRLANISQYQGNVFLQVPENPEVANQTVAIGGGSLQSAAFNTLTRFVRVHADAICSVAVGGTNPVATATQRRMAANQTEYFGVAAGDKLAVITNT